MTGCTGKQRDADCDLVITSEDCDDSDFGYGQ